MRLRADDREQLRVVELSRHAPQITHLQHFTAHLDEWRGDADRPPREGKDAPGLQAGDTTDRFRHLHAALEPVATKEKHGEENKPNDRLEQPCDGFREVWQ